MAYRVAPNGPAPKLPKFEQEIGSSFQLNDLMFTGWLDGAVFDYGEWESRDIESMLERDGKARALEAVLTLPIRGARWSIKPGRGDSGEAAFVEEFLNKDNFTGGMSVPIEQVIGQATSAFAYRKAFFEKVFKQQDGAIVYDKLAFRPASTCGVLRDPDTGGFQGFQQRPVRLGLKADMMPVNIPSQYALVIINNKHRNPIRGISDLDVAYWCHQTKLKLLYIWFNYLEAHAIQKLVVMANDIDAAKTAARQLVTLKNSGVAAISKEEDVTVTPLQTTSGADQMFKSAIDYLDSQAALSQLAGFIDLSGAAASGRGSLALSKDQSDFFLRAQQAKAVELASDLTNYMVSDLILYNFGPKAAFPRFTFGPLVDTDSSELINMMMGMATAPAGQLQLPWEFLEEIAIKVASALDMDVGKISKAMSEQGKKAEAQAAAMGANPPGQKVAKVGGAVQGAWKAISPQAQSAALQQGTWGGGTL